MSKNIPINEVDRVEILTLQDNYIEITAMDNTAVVNRATALQDMEFKSSILAEHGFSALVKTTTGDRTRTLLFDFGFSDIGAAHNARVLGADLSKVEAIALSHGHSDHTGGFDKMMAMIGKKELELTVHPSVFKKPRYLKIGPEFKIHFPKFERETVEKAGLKVVESKEPRPLLDGDILFLGEVPRRTDFEKGFPIAFCQEGGEEKWDAIEDDTSVVMNVKGKGLVILSGCAPRNRQHGPLCPEVTGVEQVHVVMGGFHLSGPLFEPIIGRTTEELKKINPAYVIPTHCTGRKAIMEMEKEMKDAFILNMSGTKLTFAA